VRFLGMQYLGRLITIASFLNSENSIAVFARNVISVFLAAILTLHMIRTHISNYIVM
jgi:hypothetical protein